MICTPLDVIAAGLLLIAAPVDGQVQKSVFHDYQVVPVAERLEHPWSVAWSTFW